MAQIDKIAIDLDGTISEYPEFFKILTAALSGFGCRIYVVTDRPVGTEQQVAQQLRQYGITYDVIRITADKASYLIREGIAVLFDDVDNYFVTLPPDIAVFKIRQKYNFDFKNKKWK